MSGHTQSSKYTDTSPFGATDSCGASPPSDDARAVGVEPDRRAPAAGRRLADHHVALAVVAGAHELAVDEHAVAGARPPRRRSPGRPTARCRSRTPACRSATTRRRAAARRRCASARTYVRPSSSFGTRPSVTQSPRSSSHTHTSGIVTAPTADRGPVIFRRPSAWSDGGQPSWSQLFRNQAVFSGWLRIATGFCHAAPATGAPAASERRQREEESGDGGSRPPRSTRSHGHDATPRRAPCHPPAARPRVRAFPVPPAVRPDVAAPRARDP